ncbi:MAG: hypothetical protein VR73_09390 [Gammaproteobacteria bacterium BRH_c0]|nr:MAG: hypothetical protein VR73_09390 [Gammaproteobacteria bacterium BRH_c0]
MSRSANPVAVGLFTLVALALAVLLVLLFSGSNWWSPTDRYVLIYDSSIRGLNIGAPVTLKGVKIGQVTDIRTSLHGKDIDVLNTVTIEIDATSMELEDAEGKAVSVKELVKRGLRAQLRQQSLLTGLLYVDVDFDPAKPALYKKVKTEYPQLPTTPTNLQQLTRDLENVDVNKLVKDLQETFSGINRLLNDPAMQQLAANVGSAVQALEVAANDLSKMGIRLGRDYAEVAQSANTLLTGINRDMPQRLETLDETLANLNQSAAMLEEFSANAAFIVSDDSPTLYRLNSASKSINEAAEQLRNLSDLLERQPEVLIFGKPDKE